MISRWQKTVESQGKKGIEWKVHSWKYQWNYITAQKQQWIPHTWWPLARLEMPGMFDPSDLARPWKFEVARKQNHSENLAKWSVAVGTCQNRGTARKGIARIEAQQDKSPLGSKLSRLGFVRREIGWHPLWCNVENSILEKILSRQHAADLLFIVKLLQLIKEFASRWSLANLPPDR